MTDQDPSLIETTEKDDLLDFVESIEALIKQIEVLEWALRGIVVPCNHEGDKELFDPVKIADIALTEVQEIRFNEKVRIYGKNDADKFVYNERRILRKIKPNRNNT